MFRPTLVLRLAATRRISVRQIGLFAESEQMLDDTAALHGRSAPSRQSLETVSSGRGTESSNPLPSSVESLRTIGSAVEEEILATRTRSIGGLEPQVAVTVDGPDLDIALLPLSGQAQPDRDPGLPALPQCAVEISEVVHRGPVERRDQIAAADARAIPRTVQGDATDDELAVELLQIDAEPRTRRG